MATLTSRTARPSALSLLLTRYLAGQIADTQWAAISDALDTADVDRSERAAYAAFCVDAASREEVDLPVKSELKALLAITRV